MFFSSIKEINKLLKEINMLLSKETSNTYLKVAIEKMWRTQNFDFLSLKVCLQVSFWGAQTHTDVIKLLKFLLQIENQRSGRKTVCGFSIIFNWVEIMRFEVKESMLFVEQK